MHHCATKVWVLAFSTDIHRKGIHTGHSEYSTHSFAQQLSVDVLGTKALLVFASFHCLSDQIYNWVFLLKREKEMNRGMPRE